jgi:PKD repeat protein
LVILCLSAALLLPAAGLEAQTLYEQWLGVDSVVAANYTNTRWIGQSFTAVADHTISSVIIQIGKDGSPGDITVALMECWTHDFGGGYVLHNPYGVILRSVTMPESYVDVVAPSTAYFQFSFAPYTLGAGRVYAIVMTSSGLTTTDRYIWANHSWGGYPGGQFVNDMQNLWQGTSTGRPDLVFQVYGNPATYIPTGTGSGPAGMSTSNGSVNNLAAASVPLLNKPPNTAFPDGGYSFEVNGLPTGGSTEVTYTAPDNLPVGTQWWKWDDAGNWTAVPIGSDDGDSEITFTLTDGGPLDANPDPGDILDPGGPGFLHVVVCDFSGAPTSGVAPLTVDFSDQSNQDIDTWDWDFDDNGSVDSTLESPSFTYSSPGTYDVSLSVSSLGVVDDETKTSFVIVYAPCAADFSADPTSGMGPLTVNFTDLSTGDIDAWAWDFDDDGQIDSTEQNPTWVYDQGGLYTVSLAVSGPGGSDSTTRDDYVDVAQQEHMPVPALSGTGTLLFMVLLACAAALILRRTA